MRRFHSAATKKINVHYGERSIFMRRLQVFFMICVAFSVLFTCALPAAEKAPVKIGMIGLDTSHAIAFPRIFKQFENDPDIPPLKVVAGCPQSMSDNPSSYTRVDKYTKQLKNDFNLKIVDTIDELLPLCDTVMIMSVDGRPHLEQARPVFKAGKPLFIDKPLAGSYKDAQEIVRLSKETGVPFFSASALRFVDEYIAIKNDDSKGRILGCNAVSPCSFEPHHPDLYWYGVHGVEPLFMIMGKGCKEVWRIHTKDYDLAVGRWTDGRIGTFRGMRKGPHNYQITVWREKGTLRSPLRLKNIYGGLAVEIARFFHTGKPPVDPEETLEAFAFMSAADLSKERGGKPVLIKELDTQK